MHKYIQEWTACTFKNWNGSNSYEAICGKTPKFQLSAALATWVYLCASGMYIFIYI
jgi:hypothetical protein